MLTALAGWRWLLLAVSTLILLRIVCKDNQWHARMLQPRSVVLALSTGLGGVVGMALAVLTNNTIGLVATCVTTYAACIAMHLVL
nr:hypothetical protein WG33_0057 [uncultured bacterium]